MRKFVHDDDTLAPALLFTERVAWRFGERLAKALGEDLVYEYDDDTSYVLPLRVYRHRATLMRVALDWYGYGYFRVEDKYVPATDLEVLRHLLS